MKTVEGRGDFLPTPTHYLGMDEEEEGWGEGVNLLLYQSMYGTIFN